MQVWITQDLSTPEWVFGIFYHEIEKNNEFYSQIEKSNAMSAD